MLGAWRANLYWILFSLGLSAILWIVISGQQNPYRDDVIQNVAVEVQGVPSGLVEQDLQPRVAVRVSAPVDVWPSVQSSILHAYVDASKVVVGYQDLPLKVESSDWRVRVMSWQPSTVGLQFDIAQKKEVPVRIGTSGEAPFGYVASNATVVPQQVVVSGSEGLVSKVSAVAVDVSLQDARTSINKQVAPIPVDELGDEIKGVSIIPETVTAQVTVEQQVSYKTLPMIPKLVGSPALGYQLSGVMVDPAVITVVGEANILRDISSIQTLAVDISNANGDQTVNTGLDLPTGVSVVRKQNVVVRAYVQAAEGSQTMIVAPVVTGLSNWQTATCQPGTVQVMVAGPIPILTTLKAEDIGVTLDASDLQSGSTEDLSPKVTVPSAIRVIQVVPETFNVTVK